MAYESDKPRTADGKAVFFEKKQQKTFAPVAHPVAGRTKIPVRRTRALQLAIKTPPITKVAKKTLA